MKESEPRFPGRRLWWREGRERVRISERNRGYQQRGRRSLKMNTWHKGKGWSWVLLGKEEGTKALSAVVEQMAIMVWARASREHY